MSYETVLSYEQRPEAEENQHELLRRRAETLQRVENRQVPATEIGDFALRLIVGGAFTAGVAPGAEAFGAMPTTKKVTLELLAGTTEIAGNGEPHRLAA